MGDPTEGQPVASERLPTILERISKSVRGQGSTGGTAGGRIGGRLLMEALVPFMIAVVSLVGAAVTWRASDAAENAGGLDAQVLRETVELQQIHRQIEAVLAHDQRIFVEYRAHIHAWRDLERRAGPAGSELAQRLRSEAQARLAMARTLRPMFRAYRPDFGDDAGTVTYDEELARSSLESGQSRLSQLDPEGTLALATSRHQHAVALIAVVIVLVAALFLLTVAQLGTGFRRVTFGALGIVAAVVASGAFVVIETTAR